jgi:hypothetical protein
MFSLSQTENDVSKTWCLQFTKCWRPWSSRGRRAAKWKALLHHGDKKGVTTRVLTVEADVSSISFRNSWKVIPFRTLSKVSGIGIFLSTHRNQPMAEIIR